ncbi:MAG TPA: GrpB family protein [Legionella sp.]|nr:GrpB family protein [Legionella sp.]
MIDSKEKIRHVVLTAPSPEWPILFNESATEIKNILGENCVDIHHIGSTAIPNIYAKPIVDILPIVKNIKLVDSLKKV